jgi:hypothetical protein
MRNCLQLLVLFILYLTLPHTRCTFQLHLLLVHQLALVQLNICLGKGISMLQGMMMFQLFYKKIQTYPAHVPGAMLEALELSETVNSADLVNFNILYLRL